MSPTARSMNSAIQTVHSFLMRRLSSLTSEILVHAALKRTFRAYNVRLMMTQFAKRFTTFETIILPVVIVAIQ